MKGDRNSPDIETWRGRKPEEEKVEPKKRGSGGNHEARGAWLQYIPSITEGEADRWWLGRRKQKVRP